MKTIFITIPWFTPAFKAGGPIRSINNLVNKFDKDVHYFIFCSNKDVDGEKLKNIETDKWIIFNQYTKVWFDSSAFPFLKFRKLISERKFDVLYINGIFSFSFSIFPMLFGKAEKVIVSPRGMLHPGALSKKKIKKKLFLQFLQITDVTKRCHFHAVDLMEKNCINGIFRKRISVTIAGNYASQFKHAFSHKKKVGELKLITVALISPMKNHLMILKALKEINGLVEYHIIGGIKDNVYWKKCLEIINEMPKNIKVKFHGEIPPNDISQYFNDSPVMIMPSESESFGHSIIESLMAGIPVITSNATPWKYLQENNAGFNAVPDIPTLKELIRFYLSLNDEEYCSTSLAAVAYSNKHYNEIILNKEYTTLLLQ